VSAMSGRTSLPADRDHARARCCLVRFLLIAFLDRCIPGAGHFVKGAIGGVPLDSGDNRLDAKFFAEIEAADLGIIHDIVFAAFHEDLAGVNDVRAIGEV
jgi:hypothetical protein